MFTKIILNFLLISWCLAESLAKPLENNETYDLCQIKNKYTTLDPSDKGNNLPASIKVLKFMLVALKDDGIIYLTKAKHVSEDLLKDPVLKENHSVEVKEFMERIKEFSDKYSTCSDMHDFFKLLFLFSRNTSDFYDKEKGNNLSDDGKVILEVLKKYKIHEIESEFERKFMEFALNLANKVKHLQDELKGEIEDDSKLKWWNEFKSAKTLDDRMEVLANYADLYGMEKKV
ncbi:uncharacterized protein ACRADG_004422 [Cochliomyia hominivorax]